MHLLSSPRNKLLAASALLLALGTAASIGGMNSAAIARAILACASIAGFGWWYVKGRRANGDAGPARLAVVCRTGLSQRAGVALIEVDGKSFLIVHGDGYAQVHPTERSAS
jgi:flagellar protein FliO/FliZ